MEDNCRDSSVSAISTQTPMAADPASEAPRRRSGALKRKMAALSSSSGIGNPSLLPPPSKRAAKEKKPQHSRPPLHNGPLTRARQSPQKFAASVAASTSSVVHTQKLAEARPVSIPAAVAESLSTGGDPVLSTKEPEVPDPIFSDFEAVISRSSDAHVVPTPAGWFSWTQINPIEKRSLPSFFSQKSEGRTPDSYMEIRNDIMKKFHKDPQTMIEVKHLSEMSAGDSDSTQQVMEFLDHWGLINFHPFPPEVAGTSAAVEERASKTASLIERLYHFEAVQPNLMAGPDFASPVLLSHLLPESAIADDLVRPEGPAVEYHCNSCSADCSRKRYHCQTQADFDLCFDCYSGGKFGSGMTPADFILMEHAEVPGASGGSWTDQETLLLLEALELYGENWNEIAEHVATKTRTQCILHFVQMPIEDSFLECEDDDGNDFHPNNVNQRLLNQDSSALGTTEKAVHASSFKGQPDLSPMDISNPKNDSSLNNIDPDSANKAFSSLNDAAETRSSESDQKHIPSRANGQKPDDAVKVEVSPKNGSVDALAALKAAFEAFGPLPNRGGLLSFVEAGNPVMTLASFMAGLVEADVAAAAARCSLKSLSEESPNVQLAMQHCFLLEDPPNSEMHFPDNERAVTDIMDERTQKEEEHNSSLKLHDELLDSTEQAVSENEPLNTAKESADELKAGGSDSLPLQENTQSKSADELKAGESDSLVLQANTESNSKEPENSNLLGEAAPSSVEEPQDACPEEILPVSSTVKESTNSSLLKGREEIIVESGELASQVKGEQFKELKVVESEKDSSNGVEEPKKLEREEDSLNGVEEPKKLEREEDSRNGVEEPEKLIDSTIESGTIEGGGETKTIESKVEVKCKPAESKYHHIDKIKRAAVTALSAAAVKTKFLANQEEEQIRELVALLIEKQLHKMEMKLSLFTEMENAIVRAREQLDRVRQRLYHERAQIIAARLGLPAPSSRHMTPSIPISRSPSINYVNSVSKPQTIISQKP